MRGSVCYGLGNVNSGIGVCVKKLLLGLRYVIAGGYMESLCRQIGQMMTSVSKNKNPGGAS